ncbi:MAG: hypothetical protein QOE70_4079 [Chthoniobacter sp.]|nr:hypothetical protein [Chthoniobacter sp.]
MKYQILAGLLALPTLATADQRGDQPDAPPSTPQAQLASFHVPPGFEVQLVAAEPEIQKPINLNFDSAGRLWATGSELYPWAAATDVNELPIPGFAKTYQESADFFAKGNAPAPSLTGKDTVRVLSDFGPDGRARKIVTFADGLNIPTGIQPLPRKAGAKGDTAILFSIPNIWRFEDTDGDGRADKKEPLYEGFGFVDTHGMSSNYLYWIDGWIYGCHGFKNHSEVRDRAGRVTVFDSGNTYRFRPDGSAIEYYTHGQTNPFGLAFDELGNLYSADSHSKPVYMLIRGGYYEGIGKQHDGLGFAPRITEDDHGSTAIAGIAYYADDKWPEEYRGNLFNGNPVTRRINRDRLEWHGSTPKAIRMPDFLTCDDPWFRPVQVKLGPDGALWIADFYNPIIGHYEVPLTDPRRDHAHGRIWRIVYRGEKKDAPIAGDAASGRVGVPPAAPGVPPGASNVASASPRDQSDAEPRAAVPGGTPATAGRMPTLPMPDLTRLDAAGLIEKLADPNLIVRTLATHELVDRIGKEGIVKWKLSARPEDLSGPDVPAKEDWDGQEPFEGGAFWKLAPVQRSHLLWVMERTAELEVQTLWRAIGISLADRDIKLARHTPATRPIGLRIQADRNPTSPTETMIFERALESKDSMSRRIAAEGLSLHILNGGRWVTYSLYYLAALLAQTPADDIELTYTARLALREVLRVSSDYERFTEGLRKGDQMDDMRRLFDDVADVSLGVPTAEAADFLLAHLERTKLATPRAAEFLRHAALHLPAERLPEVFALVDKMKGAPFPQRIALANGLAGAARARGIKLPDGTADWSQRTLLEALGSSDDMILLQGLEAVRDLKIEAKLEPLTTIARDSKRAGGIRLAALEAAANLGASPLLTTTLEASSHMIMRKRAAELLVQNGAAEVALAALATAPWELACSIAGALARNDAGADRLLSLVETGKAPAALLQNKAVAGAFATRPRPLRERAAALTKDLPPEDARIDGVIAARVDAYRKGKPDAGHGAQVFQQNCAVCHRFRNAGGNVGPNLDGMAVRGDQRLIEDILDPSRNVDPAFRQTMIELKDGRMVAGANLREQSDAVTLADATGKDIVIATADIKTRIASKLSLMPPAFENQIAPADFLDLLAYLLTPAEAPPR